MRTFAIGDIHGCLDALRALVALAGIKPKDRLITLGDYVDKGPDTRRVLDWLCEREARGSLIALRGNHDLMMLEARNDEGALAEWLLCNGDTTLDSYGRGNPVKQLRMVPDTHWRFLEQTRLFHEEPTHFFVHGNVYPEKALADQPDYMLLWEKFYDPPPHCSGKVMVCGHTSQKTGEVNNLGHAVCIDTWACGDGWLTCLEPETGLYWQADQFGRTREAQL